MNLQRAFAVSILAFHVAAAFAQATPPAAPDDKAVPMAPIVVKASADASAEGLSPAYPGGQVARGGRAGILGTKDNLETPFSITAYTNELIQDKQARSVGDVLQNDPGVRIARGFGNFQEAYFIRGFILSSDDVAYNGLYSLLPRQYIATELFERVEVLRGATAFLGGASPGGDGIGGAINLLPKRAPNEPLNRVTLGFGDNSQYNVSADIARRFGPDGAMGVRINGAYRDGGTSIDDEHAELGLASIGLDWRSRDVRLSGDLGYQDNRLRQTRTNVSLGSGVTSVPGVPDAARNFAQPWSYSNEKDLFGTLRGEWDIARNVTLYGAYGLRRSEEANSLANITVDDGTTGASSVQRFDNTREDRVDTGEVGVRGKFRTGSVGHEWVVAASYFQGERDNAYAFDFFNSLPTNLYSPISHPQPAFSPATFYGNEISSPSLTGRTRLTSIAIGDTLSFLDNTLLATVGLRDQKLKVENFAYTTHAADPAYDDSRVSPAVGVVYRASKRLSLYANYIEGLTQGETAPSTAANLGEMLAPYVSKQKEVGVKYDAGRLGMSAAYFSTDKPRAIVDSSNTFTSNGEDRHQGLEFTLYGEAAPGLRVLGGATWLDAKQENTGSSATDGKRVIGVPRWQANFGIDWDIRAVEGLAVDARVVYTGSSFADGANTLEVPGWTRLDLGVRYLVEVQGKPVTLRARLDNATDKNYWASVGGFPGIGYLVVGAPRTFTLSGSVDF
ncbi:Ferrichrome receptor FcuA [Usitatibacter rugosus]|uniref:Ferrichrome receptor FcuA n=1 Tax=Usitatibacter rugosus TaxID=2732067 RepID=A0A6M4GU25_9PROT|nr:TonB-dependent receptor [Usitatibacter rugosus]QJR10338.1 Ferrichrome receptor FcuA [Usitatibacter rugosus]